MMAVRLGARRLASCCAHGVSGQRAAQRAASALLCNKPTMMGGPRRSYNSSGNSWRRFLDGGKEGIAAAVVMKGGRTVNISWVDGHSSDFSLKWLRDNSNGALNVNTKQREFDTFKIPSDTKVTHASVQTMPAAPSSAADTDAQPQQVLQVRWDADGNEEEDEACTVPIARLRQHCSSETARSLRQKFGTTTDVVNPDPTSVLWGHDVFSPTIANNPLCFDYKAVMADETSVSQLIGVLKSHGIARVRGAPTDVAGTEALGLKLGGHLMGTYYGKNSWTVSTETVDTDYSSRDAAYTTKAIALHTDCCFLAEPPGMQVFNCEVPSASGGESAYVDGFAVAERLRTEYPEAFEFFTKTPLTYQTYDAGYYYVSQGPVFTMGSHRFVDKVRHNDYHRAPLDYMSADDIERFYEYHESLSAIIRDPPMVARLLLEPGDTVIFNNHRALHGRESFQGWRRMVGCYLGMDEAKSAARMKGI